MKKYYFAAIMLCVVIMLGSCRKGCYVHPQKNVPYDENGYNSVAAIMSHFYQGCLTHTDISYVQGIYTFDTDDGITDIEVKAYGFLDTLEGNYNHAAMPHLWTTDTIWFGQLGAPWLERESHQWWYSYDPGGHMDDLLYITYDQSNTDIINKIRANNCNDTVYVKGRLRWIKWFVDPDGPHYFHLYPGIYIDNAEDISLTPLP